MAKLLTWSTRGCVVSFDFAGRRMNRSIFLCSDGMLECAAAGRTLVLGCGALFSHERCSYNEISLSSSPYDCVPPNLGLIVWRYAPQVLEQRKATLLQLSQPFFKTCDGMTTDQVRYILLQWCRRAGGAERWGRRRSRENLLVRCQFLSPSHHAAGKLLTWFQSRHCGCIKLSIR